jgi:hypothetical protein
MKSILDRSFRYTPSFATDIKATFARIRRERRTTTVVAPANVARFPEHPPAKAQLR